MDIKYVWIYEVRKYAFVLTVLDTFTRYVLNWVVGYTMKSEQVKATWEYVIANYLQPASMGKERIDIEVRNDNGKQFNSDLIINFFKENHLNQVSNPFISDGKLFPSGSKRTQTTLKKPSISAFPFFSIFV